MLGDWELHRLPKGRVADMSPRHAPEILFRPNTLNVRRDSAGEVVIASISGYLLENGQPFSGCLCNWEWDRTRDPLSPLVEDLIDLASGTKGT